MRLTLLAAGTRLPAWVGQGFDEYAQRMPPELKLELIEIPLGLHGKVEPAKAMREEGERMIDRLAPRAHLVALEVGGKPWSSEQLARELERWMMDGRDLAFAIGGPAGLAPEVLARAGQRWSLSPLTLPHALVRPLVAEALYRAWTIVRGHPYHRN
jgi:23S rRNA (pseudouridine1915-N3)-methyltransferase